MITAKFIKKIIKDTAKVIINNDELTAKQIKNIEFKLKYIKSCSEICNKYGLKTSNNEPSYLSDEDYKILKDFISMQKEQSVVN